MLTERTKNSQQNTSKLDSPSKIKKNGWKMKRPSSYWEEQTTESRTWEVNERERSLWQRGRKLGGVRFEILK